MGLSDNTIIEWRTEYVYDQQESLYISKPIGRLQTNESSRMIQAYCQHLDRELKFSQSDCVIVEALKDTFALFRGTTKKILN